MPGLCTKLEKQPPLIMFHSSTVFHYHHIFGFKRPCIIFRIDMADCRLPAQPCPAQLSCRHSRPLTALWRTKDNIQPDRLNHQTGSPVWHIKNDGQSEQSVKRFAQIPTESSFMNRAIASGLQSNIVWPNTSNHLWKTRQLQKETNNVELSLINKEPSFFHQIPEIAQQH